MAKTPMTQRGAELLRAELHRLKTVDRPNVVQAIANSASVVRDPASLPTCVMAGGPSGC